MPIPPEPDAAGSVAPLYDEAIRATRIGLAINLGLGLSKLAGGLAGQSFALVSDAVNSLGDSLTSVITLFALRLARRPPNPDHPYGYTRVESVAASHVALVIIGSALLVGWESLRHLSTPHGVPPAWTLLIAAANAAIKEGLYWYSRGVGRRTGSTAILANAWDHRSDALCSLAVLLGLGIVRLAGDDYIWADEAAALIVALAILWSGVRLFFSSTRELLDPQADAELVAEIRQVAESMPGVCAVEKLRVRKSGLEYLVDIHLQVDANLTVARGHEIGHQVQDRLLSTLAPVRSVLVHLEPFQHEELHRPAKAIGDGWVVGQIRLRRPYLRQELSDG